MPYGELIFLVGKYYIFYVAGFFLCYLPNIQQKMSTRNGTYQILPRVCFGSDGDESWKMTHPFSWDFPSSDIPDGSHDKDKCYMTQVTQYLRTEQLTNWRDLWMKGRKVLLRAVKHAFNSKNALEVEQKKGSGIVALLWFIIWLQQ